MWKTGAVLRLLDVGFKAFEILRVKGQGTGIREGEHLTVNQSKRNVKTAILGEDAG